MAEAFFFLTFMIVGLCTIGDLGMTLPEGLGVTLTEGLGMTLTEGLGMTVIGDLGMTVIGELWMTVIGELWMTDLTEGGVIKVGVVAGAFTSAKCCISRMKVDVAGETQNAGNSPVGAGVDGRCAPRLIR